MNGERNMLHRRTTLKLGTAFAAASALPARAADDVAIIDNVELSGTGVTSGSQWKMGVDLAVQEINAAGGILGRKIAMTHQDNQSQAQIAKAVATKLVDAEPYVGLGPIFSGSVNVSMAVTENAEMPTFIGGEAANLTNQGMKYLFRTSLNQAAAMPKLANFLVQSGIKSMVVIWGNNDFGKGGRDAMVKEMAARNIKLAGDISTEPGQMDFSAVVVNATKANADAIFAYMNEEESARFLIALRKLGYTKPVYGETVLVSQKVIELAGAAANGAIGHVGLSVDAPNKRVQEFGRKFEAAYKQKSDHNGIKGYTAVYLIKYATEKLGKFDRKALAASIHGAHFLAEKYPGLLMDVMWDDKGDLDRESYLAEVRDGKQVITQTLPPINKI
jgi:branched-chain amino acid transport system substrate-binding protein